jgi:hypothetical protein
MLHNGSAPLVHYRLFVRDILLSTSGKDGGITFGQPRREVFRVRVCGFVLDATESGPLTVVLDDGTGVISVHLRNELSTPSNRKALKGQFVECLGAIKHGKQRTIAADRCVSWRSGLC